MYKFFDMIEWIKPKDSECKGAYFYGYSINDRERSYLQEFYNRLSIYSRINLHQIKKDDGWYYLIPPKDLSIDPDLSTKFWERSYGIRCTNIQEVMICFASFNPNTVEYIYEHSEDFILKYLGMIKKIRPIHKNDYHYVKGEMGKYLRATQYDRRNLLKDNTYTENFLDFVRENVD